MSVEMAEETPSIIKVEDQWFPTVQEEDPNIYITIETVPEADCQPIEEVDLEWLPKAFNLIEVSDDGYIRGYVTSEEEVKLVLQAHAANTHSLFIINQDDTLVKQRMRRRVYLYCKLLDIASHASSSGRTRRFICKFGTKYYPIRRPKGRRVNGTSKTGCPANICITEIIVYNEFPLTGMTARERRKMFKNLKEALEKDPSSVSCETYYHMKLPLECTHRGHDVTDHAWMLKKTHPKILKKIEELTLLGIRKMSIFKGILKAYAEDSLVEGNLEEFKNVPYYFPRVKTIRNKMASVIRKHGLSKGRIAKTNHESKPKKRRIAKCEA